MKCSEEMRIIKKESLNATVLISVASLVTLLLARKRGSNECREKSSCKRRNMQHIPTATKEPTTIVTSLLLIWLKIN
jgi:hypothetical protein